MRSRFFRTLCGLAECDRRVWLAVGDIGFGAVDEFVRRFPERFVNAGVAEQNLAAVSTGLALDGKVVFMYSIANFPTLRCLEQIRNDICGHRADVKIVSVGAGFSYGPLGMTHHATEDLALLRAMPGMTVVCPGDRREVEGATRAAVEHPGPWYLRLGRSGEPDVHPDGVAFVPGRALAVRDGRDAAILSSGSMLSTAVRAAELLSGRGIGARVVSVHTLRPMDVETVLEASRSTRLVVTVEEHSVVGGLGSAVAEVLSEVGAGVRLLRIAIPSEFASRAGSQEYLREAYGLTPARIADRIATALRQAP